MEHAKLQKYNTIVQGELIKTKQQLEKLDTSSDKIEEKILVQRPSYDKTGLGFFLRQCAKNFVERKEPSIAKVEKDLRKIKSLIKLKHIKKKEKSFMVDALHVMKLDTLRMVKQASPFNLFQSFIVIIVMVMDIM